MWAVILKVAVVIGELLIKFGRAQKVASDAQKASALEKTLESVDASLDVEKDIRDKQDAVDKDEKTVKGVGGLDFSNFNEEKKPDA